MILFPWLCAYTQHIQLNINYSPIESQKSGNHNLEINLWFLGTWFISFTPQKTNKIWRGSSVLLEIHFPLEYFDKHLWSDDVCVWGMCVILDSHSYIYMLPHLFFIAKCLIQIRNNNNSSFSEEKNIFSTFSW